jgi:hypothetical protein
MDFVDYFKVHEIVFDSRGHSESQTEEKRDAQQKQTLKQVQGDERAENTALFLASF